MDEVRTKPNPRRAAILGEEARVAAAEGLQEAASFLERRAFAYLCGQR